ncbi:osmotically inducible protein OsmC [Bacterioplanes sanyensis]|uniref:Osmotically inducible protein OsmC n=1 Tax=Bacterioplanes sanyensis TaxID=1249553 RepID=A0A222FI79_9GAMM|nr:OsmC family protein [Bacterioplanes sanyensis]ASP38296.1 osmotically inducible protein OsmC [Bacterioplanes sanyensis]
MQHIIRLQWQRRGEFSHAGFERRHELEFQPQVSIAAGGANNDFGADPEQMLAAAMASCHMQTFLALAAKKRLQVERYQDEAIASLAQRDDGKFWVDRIVLQPQVVFAGESPAAETIKAMHDKAHQHCFIANSVTTEVDIRTP